MKNVLPVILAAAVAAQAADLPVKQVVLYKHGVGFFERSGTLAAGESARLDFNASDMNDVLKSLTLTDSGGAKISGLRYDSMDPLSHKLAEFPFQIDGGQSLASMFDQLKGSRVELKLGADTIAGVIVTGRVVPGTDKQSERQYLTLLLDSGEMKVVDLDAATGIRFPDPKLQSQFKDYLSALAAARSKDKRSVYIDSTGSASRDVVASYMIPTAVWKSSYRLIFGNNGKPTLEGWAIVDNTTGEDWNKVQLSLVSGRPISFVSQLYPPKYIQRPGAELADDAAARPVVHDEAYDALSINGSVSGGLAGAQGGGRGGRGGPGGARSQMAMPSAAPAPVFADQFKNEAKVAPSTIVASASAGELGELFEYRLAQPITIRKDESAMLPFLQQAIDGRKLLIYSDHSSQHPTNAAELTNSTGKTLDGGPITVYEAGAYGGEALMETLKAGDKRLISYAVDLGTRITDAFNSKNAVVREIHANRGVLTVKAAQEEVRTYTIRNVDNKAKTLILEHPLRRDYTLLNQKPSEKTATNYRFEIALAPNSTQEFPVSEERVFDQVYQLTNVTPDFIGTYIQNRTLSDAGRRQLQAIADKKTQIAENDSALRDAQDQIRDLTADEDRIRQNINSLNNVSSQQQLVQGYAKQLDAHEQQLATLRDRQADLNKKKTALQSDLNKLMDTLSFYYRAFRVESFSRPGALPRYNRALKLALIGYGNVGRALVRLLQQKHREHPFTVTGIHTLRHGTAVNPAGLPADPAMGPRAATIEAFLDAARAEIAVELTTLNPSDGEPAISHIRAAFARGMHVVTANKGPIAHAYAFLRDEAAHANRCFRFESAVMDGAPIFNLWRHTMPAVTVNGFAGALNSTSKIVVEMMEQGGTMEEGLAKARSMGITEADGAYDIEGWDSAAKTAALANVLMDARTTPQAVSTRGIGRLTPARVQELMSKDKTVRLISRAHRAGSKLTLRVRAEVLDRCDLLACTPGTANTLLFHTDLMGTFGVVSLDPQVEQTAYGVFADLVDVAQSVA